MAPRVEIGNGGRAGTITYREGLHTASFDWEFGGSPALAIITGPRTADWDRLCPWAAGRQAEIFEHVATEVVRQKASGCGHEIDLAAGVITILESRSARPPRRRGTRPVSPLDPVSNLGDAELEELIQLILRDGISGPVVDALGQIDHPRANAAVEEASRDHLSVDVRLAAAEALHAHGRLPDLEPVLTRELRMLNRAADGLARALRLAEAHPTPAVKQALLWASWNQTECAPECARLLLRLVGGEGAVNAFSATLPKLGLHVSHFDRKAAFDALCQQLGMSLDPG
jgi:hypothetical protein